MDYTPAVLPVFAAIVAAWALAAGAIILTDFFTRVAGR